jgi:hypothetical protein
MKRVLFFLLTLALLLPLATQAQTWSPEQKEVWKVVADSWVAETERDANWYEQFVHPSFQGWSMDTPHPVEISGVAGRRRGEWGMRTRIGSEERKARPQIQRSIQ